MQALGISETEYRLNWIPLGGYVKMLGQDDMNPNSDSLHPRAYNNKSIPKRMVIVSAGVVMNIILAIALFTALFRYGFRTPPAIVGGMLTHSPAQVGGLRVGDRILSYDGAPQHDFNKFGTNVALSEEAQPVKLVVERPDATDPKKSSRVELTVTPRKSESDLEPFLQMGVSPTFKLQGFDKKLLTPELEKELADSAIRPEETVVAVEGAAVNADDYHVLHRALQSGRPVTITVQTASGAKEDRQIKPEFAGMFDGRIFDIAGMVPRTTVVSIIEGSSAKDKLKEGDVVAQITVVETNDPIPHPSPSKLREVLGDAGKNSYTVDFDVIRDGQPVTVRGLKPAMYLQGQGGKKGLGIALGIDESSAIVGAVLEKSAAENAGIPAGAKISSINDQPIADWHDLHRALAASKSGEMLRVAFVTNDGVAKQVELSLSPEQLADVQEIQYTARLAMRELLEARETKNPLVAAQWGVLETRDQIKQFYLILRRMVQGSIPASAASGPVGIFHQGSKIANRGTDWLVWFLALISANLAVVNFLPIPIVDGGLFMFLVIEKIMGKPLSPRLQNLAHLAGLALIGSVFLFVTYHDISRLIY
jgi:regulator of sigma E protease